MNNNKKYCVIWSDCQLILLKNERQDSINILTTYFLVSILLDSIRFYFLFLMSESTNSMGNIIRLPRVNSTFLSKVRDTRCRLSRIKKMVIMCQNYNTRKLYKWGDSNRLFTDIFCWLLGTFFCEFTKGFMI